MFTVEVNNAAVLAALNRVLAQGRDLSPVLRAVGEAITRDTKARFQSATAPDGTRWQPNARATIEAYIRKKGGISAKTGKITARGQVAAMNKRPLQGVSRNLARQIDYAVTGNSVTISANATYAAIQQFGGKKSEFPKLWGDIPARPFFPVTSAGGLSPGTEHEIVQIVNEFLRQAVAG